MANLILPYKVRRLNAMELVIDEELKRKAVKARQHKNKRREWRKNETKN